MISICCNNVLNVIAKTDTADMIINDTSMQELIVYQHLLDLFGDRRGRTGSLEEFNPIKSLRKKIRQKRIN